MTEDLFHYIYIERDKMTSVYEIGQIFDLPQTAYEHFMSYENEVLYLLDSGRMEGVISIGDLERFYDKEMDKLQINRRYTSINTIDFHAAEAFFHRMKSINEIPVVSDCGELLGCIRKNKEREQRLKQRQSLMYARKGKYRWQRKELQRFINETKARVIFYSYSDKSLGKEEYECLEKRRLRIDSEGASVWQLLSDDEWKKFWLSEYEDGIVETMRKERNQFIPAEINGVLLFPDGEGKCYSYQDGYRITPGNPPNADRKIYMFGPCTVVGAYCKNDQTIEAYLQKFLIENGHMDWKVLNRGEFGGRNWSYRQMFVQELSENDIAIIMWYKQSEPDLGMEKLAFKGDLSEEFSKVPSLTDNLIDQITHCNFVVNQKLAERIYKDLCFTNLLDSPRKSGKPSKLQDYYISWDVHEYFMDFFMKHGLRKYADNVRIGAIVMNCNPFTKGHRYLIEQALDRIDELYIFVVEEDKSYFKFEDRLKMVKVGISDLHHIKVIPSGKYILSQDTFAQYFEKEQIETVQSMDYDIQIFGEIVAEKLGIRYRFVGEEPLDKVTKEYNETMKRILPNLGVEVVEIPRSVSDKTGTVISATLVRKALREKNPELLRELCPESTVSYLMDYYWT